MIPGHNRTECHTIMNLMRTNDIYQAHNVPRLNNECSRSALMNTQSFTRRICTKHIRILARNIGALQ